MHYQIREDIIFPRYNWKLSRMASGCHGSVSISRKHVAHFVIFILVFCTLIAYSDSATRGVKWRIARPLYKSSGYSLWRKADVQFSGNAFIITQCAITCLTIKNCRSYSFDAAQKLCEIHFVSHVDSPDLLRPRHGYAYHLRSTFSINKAITHTGKPHCLNSGKAVYRRHNGHWSWVCLCSENWKGRQCETPGGAVQWSSWTIWQPCDVTCNGGWQRRHRECDLSSSGDSQSDITTGRCIGPSDQTRPCNTQPCPVPYTPWSAWSKCSTRLSCGRGQQTRHRACKAAKCEWTSKNETRICYSHDCDGPVRLSGSNVYGRGRVEIFDNVRSTWGHVCSNGWDMGDAYVLCRQLGFQGVDSVDTSSDYSIVTTAYIVTNVSCTNDKLTLTSCDHGGRSHESSCDGPATVTCTTSNAEFTEWGAWSECNATCGGGIQQRNRTCVGISASSTCYGEHKELQVCSEQPCAVNGYFGNWSNWTSCDVTCGIGIQSSERACVEPLYGGSPCNGETVRKRNCSESPCPVDGVWSEWSVWSGCDVTCGSGLRTRNRTCDGMQFRGKNCTGNSVVHENCSTEPCRMFGDWSEWSEWGICSVTCGGGTESKSRQCSTDKCEGDAELTRPCCTFACSPLAATCSEWKERGMKASTEIEVDIFGDVFWVRCNMTADDGVGVTEIIHNYMGKTKVQGYAGQGEYSAQLAYNTSLEQAQTLALYSGHCSQSISWQCSGANIHNPLLPSYKMTYWTTAKGRDRYYWDGSHDSSTDACACGLTRTCVREDLLCNCDANDGVLQEDAGVITNKKDLPITKFNAGDTGGEQYGIFQIGPLRCSGIDPDYDY